STATAAWWRPSCRGRAWCRSRTRRRRRRSSPPRRRTRRRGKRSAVEPACWHAGETGTRDVMGRAQRWPERRQQYLLLATFLPLCWLGMMAVHEFGHVLGLWCIGGTVARVVLHPLTISRTDPGT